LFSASSPPIHCSFRWAKTQTVPFIARRKADCQAGRKGASYCSRRIRKPWFPSGVDELLNSVTLPDPTCILILPIRVALRFSGPCSCNGSPAVDSQHLSDTKPLCIGHCTGPVEGEMPASVTGMMQDGIVYSSLPLLSFSPALRWLSLMTGWPPQWNSLIQVWTGLLCTTCWQWRPQAGLARGKNCMYFVNRSKRQNGHGARGERAEVLGATWLCFPWAWLCATCNSRSALDSYFHFLSSNGENAACMLPS
jgi:hypothetical protein